MIYILASVAITVFTLAGITLGVAAGADAMTDKGVPKAVGIGILTLTALMFAIIVLWLIADGVIA